MTRLLGLEDCSQSHQAQTNPLHRRLRQLGSGWNLLQSIVFTFVAIFVSGGRRCYESFATESFAIAVLTVVSLFRYLV